MSDAPPPLNIIPHIRHRSGSPVWRFISKGLIGSVRMCGARARTLAAKPSLSLIPGPTCWEETTPMGCPVASHCTLACALAYPHTF